MDGVIGGLLALLGAPLAAESAWLEFGPAESPKPVDWPTAAALCTASADCPAARLAPLLSISLAWVPGDTVTAFLLSGSGRMAINMAIIMIIPSEHRTSFKPGLWILTPTALFMFCDLGLSKILFTLLYIFSSR
jgi:hypothetical protein